MNDTERKELAKHLRKMAKKIMKGEIDVLRASVENHTQDAALWNAASVEQIVTSSVLTVEYKESF